MELRPHQTKASLKLVDILNTYKCAYLRGEVRSGKTITVLETAKLFKANKVLFITKKKAISSIVSDYENFNYLYELFVVNYESIHKVLDTDYDLIIYDESHTLGGYPKPSKRNKVIKDKFYKIPCIWLTGTPAPESYSQFFNQLFINAYNPFRDYKNFYQWSKVFVNVEQKRIGTHTVNDYSKAKVNDIEEILIPYSVSMTQKDAGFNATIKEHVIKIKTPDILHNLAKKLIKERAIEGKKGYIMAEMPAKLQSKVHQIYNGTVILEDLEGNPIPHTLSDYKAKYIRERFKDKKIAIMYYYKEELNVLKTIFKNDITEDLEEFNATDKNFALQQSSSEGMNISKADCIVYYNFGFSGKNYIQSRDRLTVKDRTSNDVYFIAETPGISSEILKMIRNKKDFNSRIFISTFV